MTVSLAAMARPALFRIERVNALAKGLMPWPKSFGLLHGALVTVQVPFHTGQYVMLGKQFQCLMHYSRFIRNGSQILHRCTFTALYTSAPFPNPHSNVGHRLPMRQP